MRLRAGLRALRRGPDEVQVGTDPRWAVRVTDLAPDEVSALLAWAPDEAGAPLATAPGRAGDSPRLRHVADQLVRAGLALPDGRTQASRTADDVAWGLLRPDDEVAARSRRRAAARVGVVGLGPTGLGIATLLAAAGIGTVLLDDERPVRRVDAGAAGLRWADVGRPREEAAARVLRDVAPTVTTGATAVAADGPGEVDALVVVEAGGADPERGAHLLSTGVTHLSVVVREADTVVGPLVVPGAGPCLRCLDLHRADLDPAWPLLLSQLVGTDAEGEPGPVAAVAAGLAAAAVLAVLDGLAPAVGRTWELGLPDAVPRERVWAPHPRCGCAGLPDDEPAPAPGCGASPG